MQYKIPWRAIWNQLKNDLIGKDAYRGITLTYAWMANQFGHFALGFIPAFLLFNWFRGWLSINNAACLAAIFTCCGWFLFELFNFLKPLLSKKNKYKFKPDWYNIAFDTCTDILFFWLGAFTFSSMYTNNALMSYIPHLIVWVLIWPICYWFITKMFLQAAQYPFQFRLSQWQMKMDTPSIATVLSFHQAKESGNHLIVTGPNGSGKTSLAVALATEKSIRHRRCLYTTAVKLLGLFHDANQVGRDKDTLWSWQDADCIVIDDINTGEPVNDVFITPEIFMKHLGCNEENIGLLKAKNIIWVAGGNNEIKFIQLWENLILQIGVPANNISKVLL